MESLKIYLGTISHLVRFLVATERGLRLVGLTDDGLPGSRLRKTDIPGFLQAAILRKFVWSVDRGYHTFIFPLHQQKYNSYFSINQSL